MEENKTGSFLKRVSAKVALLLGGTVALQKLIGNGPEAKR